MPGNRKLKSYSDYFREEVIDKLDHNLTRLDLDTNISYNGIIFVLYVLCMLIVTRDKNKK